MLHRLSREIRLPIDLGPHHRYSCEVFVTELLSGLKFTESGKFEGILSTLSQAVGLAQLLYMTGSFVRRTPKRSPRTSSIKIW